MSGLGPRDEGTITAGVRGAALERRENRCVREDRPTMTNERVDVTAQSAIVTGAASGIGQAIATTLARAGYHVGLFDRDSAGLAHTAAQIAEVGPGTSVSFVGDVTDETALSDAIASLDHARGRLVAAVASAGIWLPGTVIDTCARDWQRTVDVNLTGTFLLAKAATAVMARNGSGRFVAIASDVGLQGSQDCAAYVATKHAVVGLVKAMALDHAGDNIRSNAVCPGFVATPMADQVFSGASFHTVNARQSEQPLGRFGRPTEIADLVEFLISDRSSFINGAAITCDGGSSAGYFHARQAKTPLAKRTELQH